MGLLNNTQIIKRVLAKYGKTYDFVHKAKNDYKEPTGTETGYTLFGLFHDKGKPIFNLVLSDGGTVQTKPMSHILTMDETITSVAKDDEVIINGKVFTVIAVSNYLEENLIYDVSLELML